MGWLKFTIPLTFVGLIMQYNKRDITKFIKVIPISAITMFVICGISRFIPSIMNRFYSGNGRMMGFFEYSNALAIFFLIGIIILQENYEHKVKKYIGIAILLLGILATGSRIIFALTILNFIIFIIKEKESRKYYISLMILGIIGTIIYALITNDFNTFARYLTTSLDSGSLMERFLYYKDGLPEILKKPFGLGYKGYSYIQGKIQTGPYKAIFIHSDYLQFALDIGIIPMVIFIIAILQSIFAKGLKNFDYRKQILLTIALHIILDFDLQFTYIFLILVLTLNIYSGKLYLIKEKYFILIPVNVVLCVIYLYFAICTLLQYIDKSEYAIKMYPIYTEANESVISNNFEDNIEYANMIATKIINTNEHVKIVYDVRSLYYLNQNSWKLMLNNKQKSIELGKYDMDVYNEYVLMLSSAIQYYVQNNEMDEAEKYMNLVIEIPSRIKNLQKNTSSFAYKLIEKPEFELDEKIQKYISQIKVVLETK